MVDQLTLPEPSAQRQPSSVGASPRFSVRDLVCEAMGGRHPITFGDCYVDAAGHVTARDIGLTERKERFSQVCVLVCVCPCL